VATVVGYHTMVSSVSRNVTSRLYSFSAVICSLSHTHTHTHTFTRHRRCHGHTQARAGYALPAPHPRPLPHRTQRGRRGVYRGNNVALCMSGRSGSHTPTHTYTHTQTHLGLLTWYTGTCTLTTEPSGMASSLTGKYLHRSPSRHSEHEQGSDHGWVHCTGVWVPAHNPAWRCTEQARR